MSSDDYEYSSDEDFFDEDYNVSEYEESDEEYNLNYTLTSLERTHYQELRNMCKHFGLDSKGRKTEIIDRLLEYRDANDKKLKRHLEDCKVEAEHLSKRRKIEIPNHVTMCKYDISTDVFLLILQFLPRNKELLDGPGIVNSQWYRIIRSKEIWETITLKENGTFLIPLVMLKGCTKLRLMDKFSNRSVKHIMQYCDNVKYLTAKIKKWDNDAIRSLFSNELVNSNLIYLEICDWEAYAKTVDVPWLVLDNVTSKELQCLKMNSIRAYDLENCTYYFKTMAEQYPKLRWLGIFNWSIVQWSLEPLVKRENPSIRNIKSSYIPILSNPSPIERLEFSRFSNIQKPFDNVKILKYYGKSPLDFKYFPKLEILTIFHTMDYVQLPNTIKTLICYNDGNWLPLSISSPEYPHIESLLVRVKDDKDIQSLVRNFPNLRELEMDLYLFSAYRDISLKGLRDLKSLKELKSLCITGDLKYLNSSPTPEEVESTWKEFMNELPNLENFVVNKKVFKGKEFEIYRFIPEVIE